MSGHLYQTRCLNSSDNYLEGMVANRATIKITNTEDDYLYQTEHQDIIVICSPLTGQVCREQITRDAYTLARSMASRISSSLGVKYIPVVAMVL